MATLKNLIHGDTTITRRNALNFASENNYQVNEMYIEACLEWTLLMTEIHANDKQGNYYLAELYNEVIEALKPYINEEYMSKIIDAYLAAKIGVKAIIDSGVSGDEKIYQLAETIDRNFNYSISESTVILEQAMKCLVKYEITFGENDEAVKVVDRGYSLGQILHVLQQAGWEIDKITDVKKLE